MKKVPPHTMQFIPARWQDTVALHIVAMEQALNQPSIYTPFTAATGRVEMLDESYAIACNDIIDFIETHFTTIHSFNAFLKADAQRIARGKGLEFEPSPEWNDWHPECNDAVSQAEYVRHAYVHLYAKALIEFHAQERARALTL